MISINYLSPAVELTTISGEHYRLRLSHYGVQIERGYPTASGEVHWIETAESVQLSIYGAQGSELAPLRLIHALAAALINASEQQLTSITCLHDPMETHEQGYCQTA